MATYSNQILVYVNGRVQKISSSDNLTMGGSLSLGGNLTVTGSLVVGGNGVDLMVGDKFLDINAANTSGTASAVGFTFNIKQATGKTTMTASAYGSKATYGGQARVYVSGDQTAQFSGDPNWLVQVSGADKITNNGIFAVNNVELQGGNTVLYLNTSTPSYAPWLKNDLVDSDAGMGDSPTGSVVLIDLGVLAMSDGSGIKDSTGVAISIGKMVSAFYALARLNDFNGTGVGTGYTEIGSGGSSNYAIVAGVTAGAVMAYDPYYSGLLRLADQSSPINALKEVVGLSTISVPEAAGTAGWTTAGYFDLEFTASIPGTEGNNISIGITNGNYSDFQIETNQSGPNITVSFVTVGSETPLIDVFNRVGESYLNGDVPFFVSGTGPNIDALSGLTGVGITSTIGNGAGEWFVFTDDLTGTLNNSDWIALRDLNTNEPSNDVNKGWQVANITSEGFYLSGSTGNGAIQYYGGGNVYSTILGVTAPISFSGGSGDSYVTGSVVTTSGQAADVFFGNLGATGSQNGQAIYLSSTPGEASILPPESGRVWRLGTAEERDFDSVRSVLFRPVFVTDI